MIDLCCWKFLNFANVVVPGWKRPDEDLAVWTRHYWNWIMLQLWSPAAPKVVAEFDHSWASSMQNVYLLFIRGMPMSVRYHKLYRPSCSVYSVHTAHASISQATWVVHTSARSDLSEYSARLYWNLYIHTISTHRLRRRNTAVLACTQNDIHWPCACWLNCSVTQLVIPCYMYFLLMYASVMY